VPPLLPGDPGDGHGDDDHDADDVGYVPPLPPEDRLWRHPSEVASARAVAAPAARSWVDRRTASLMFVSGMVGATLAVGGVALLHAPERIVERQVAVPVADVADDPDEIASVAARTTASVAALRVHRGGEQVLASAVALRSDGYLLTDGPSVVGADDIDVVLHDGRIGAGRLVGVDDATGVAVLRVDHDLEPAALAEGTDRLEVGQRTVAVGASLEGGWDATVSTGVVSAVSRRLEGDDGTTRHGMILVDKPFAPVAAGGALVDGAGAVIGIVSGGYAGNGGTSFGVATPIDVARHVADQVIEHGRVQHVWLGLHGTDLDIEEATSLGIAGGAVVKSAERDGPAHRAGIEAGDVIVSVDDDPTPTMSALIAVLRRHVPGDVVVLGVHRDGQRHAVRVSLAAKG
jgi:S1-C subfamily serine protease